MPPSCWRTEPMLSILPPQAFLKHCFSYVNSLLKNMCVNSGLSLTLLHLPFIQSILPSISTFPSGGNPCLPRHSYTYPYFPALSSTAAHFLEYLLLSFPNPAHSSSFSLNPWTIPPPLWCVCYTLETHREQLLKRQSHGPPQIGFIRSRPDRQVIFGLVGNKGEECFN